MTTYRNHKIMFESVCPACGKNQANELEKIDLELQHQLYAPNNYILQKELTRLARLSAEKYTMLQCNYCGLEYASPLVAPNGDWYTTTYSLLQLYPSERWEFDYVINNLKPGDLIGEVGCGSGAFLKKCKLRNINCHGLDFSASSINQCVNHGFSASLINVVEPKLDTFTQKVKKSAIFSAHTLEHLDQPNCLFKLAWKWSTDNATLWVSIPSDRRVTRLFNERDFLDQPPHHMTRWNSCSLEEIGANNGWQLQKVIYEPLSIRATIWSYATRLYLYKKVHSHFNNSNIWRERFYRYLVYPLAILRWLSAPTKITGFSMLAKYSKIKDTKIKDLG